ncbi:hypothetical protein [Pelomonas aquatica]|jgi:hypothetical protein|uniref:Lipoprotein n=2 Tax=Pelomonas aquatica TaxID=431058 RepID=A0A9X4LGX4_9BURK|nr:hypothetical protein [Pelomonas aquatica]MCY4753568.1 hypothetical protein [Pelomonas aquatica]MDG0863287.1 hypothetical protein [Pelomonas aquatica]
MEIRGRQMKRAALAAALPLALAACSGAPSDGDIKAALLADQKRSEAQAEALAAGSGPAADMVRQLSAQSRVEVVSAHKLGCKEDGEKAYRCDVEVEVSRGGKTVKAPPASIRLVKGSDGWMAQR